jgi:hypothetical protein
MRAAPTSPNGGGVKRSSTHSRRSIARAMTIV